MVCTGNICRSPTMEGVFRRFAEQSGWGAALDSAGTQGWHTGEAPDPRTVAAAGRRGYDLAGIRSRKVAADDFARFDLLLAADLGHVRELLDLAPAGAAGKVRLFLGRHNLPDPYYGGPRDFEAVLDAVEERARAWDGTACFFLRD